jgi:4-hydroxyproline epimerase
MRAIDSHTGGEPTRLVIEGGPALRGSMAERVEQLRTRFDRFRSGVVNEPRGSDVLVGALLQEPTRADCAAGVIFFNNVGYLGMCGHGTIGLIATLKWLGRLRAGSHRIETPVGVVEAVLADDDSVTVRNVPAWVHRTQVPVQVEGLGEIRGDIVYGGNWFFIVHWPTTPAVAAAASLLDVTARIRAALERAGICGVDGALIDHIELSAPPAEAGNHSRNFVLCPGLAYDRSPCGTGTSAKLALLAHEGKWAPGASWRQESVTGSVFEAWYEPIAGDPRGAVAPSIRGRAWVTADLQLCFDPGDPLRDGIRTD